MTSRLRSTVTTCGNRNKNAPRRVCAAQCGRAGYADGRCGPTSSGHGREIAALALVGPGGTIAEQDFDAALVDALINFRHFTRLHELDFERALAQSERHHRAEARSPWDAAPDD